MRTTELYYYGKVCEKHPNLGGLRNKARRTCVKCVSEASMRSIKKKREQEKVNVTECK